MVKSMTGFGKGEVTLPNRKITVEIRSLNSKQMDLSLRLPAIYRQSEYEIRNVGRPRAPAREGGRLRFGRIAGRRNLGPHQRAGTGRAYAGELRDSRPRSGVRHDGPRMGRRRTTGASCAFPTRCPPTRRASPRRSTPHCCGPSRKPCGRLDAFRSQEGAILIADLLRRVELIEGYRHEVEPFEKARTETIRARILDNLEKLAAEVDRNRLEQEMIFYLEKLDITEEKVRLDNHCRYFREVAGSEEDAGRKLGFIAQEMGREINTMGSKANEANIQRIVVQMKDELEKIKEQVLNIL